MARLGALVSALMATLFRRRGGAVRPSLPPPAPALPRQDFAATLLDTRAALAFGLAADLGDTRPRMRDGAHQTLARLLPQLASLSATWREATGNRSCQHDIDFVHRHRHGVTDLQRRLRALLFDSGHLLRVDELRALRSVFQNWMPWLAAACDASIELADFARRCRDDAASGNRASFHLATLRLIAEAQAQWLIWPTIDGRSTRDRAATALVDCLLKEAGARSLQRIERHKLTDAGAPAAGAAGTPVGATPVAPRDGRARKSGRACGSIPRLSWFPRRTH